MVKTFGSLGPLDRYFLIQNDDVFTDYPSSVDWGSSTVGVNNMGYFVNRLINGVSTFITVAKHDHIVYSPDIRYAMEVIRGDFPAGFAPITGTSYDSTLDNPFIYPAGTVKARHGRLKIDLIDGMGNTSSVYATMPGLYDAGHSVSDRAPADLLADVADWYAKSQP